MTDHWAYPVSSPLFSDLWIRQIEKQDHRKPTALGTPFRFSDALKCPRALAFTAMGVDESDPIDAAGLHVTTIGTWLHEKVQEAIGKKYPGAKFELASGNDSISGSCDGLVNPGGFEGGLMLLEIKSVSNFPFNKAIGVQGMGYRAKRVSPEGPSRSHLVQTALNAYFHDAETCVLIYVAKEAMSANVADRLGFSTYDRFLAEWHIPRDVWLPLAVEELARVEEIKLRLPEIPNGLGWDDKKGWVSTSPHDSSPHYACGFCNFRTTCAAYEAGVDVL